MIRDSRGASAIEFGLIAPIFGLILAGAIDFGGALYTKFNLDGAVSAGANFAILNNSNCGSSGGASLASNVATIVASGHAASWANTTVVVNNGPSASIASGTTTSAGTAANADNCYCPTTSGSTVTWGSALSCGSSCNGGGLAGKFVSIVASHNYNALVPAYGLVRNGGLISAQTLVEVQ